MTIPFIRKEINVDDNAYVAEILSRRTLLMLLVVVAACWALYDMWISGTLEEQSRVDTQLASTQAELTALNQRIAAIENGENDSILALFNRGQIADRLMPDNLRSNDFELNLPALIDQYGLANDGGFSRSDPISDDNGTPYVPLSMEVTGPLEQIVAFATAVENADRLIVADLFSVRRNGADDENDWEAGFQIRLYGTPDIPVMPPATGSTTEGGDLSAPMPTRTLTPEPVGA